MAKLTDDNNLFEDMTPKSPGTMGRNIIRRLGLASQVAEVIRSPDVLIKKVSVEVAHLLEPNNVAMIVHCFERLIY